MAGTSDFGKYSFAAKRNGIRLNANEPLVVATGGVVTLPATTTIGGSTVSALGVITSTSVNALTVGPGGTTNPSFNVDASTGSAITGLNVKSAASGSGVALTALGGTNELITLDGKGTGVIGINTLGTTSGLVTIGNTTSLAGATVNGPATVASASALSLAVGRLGATTPAFSVDSSTGTQVAGLKVTGAATGGTVAVVATDSGGATNLTINAKGTGTIALGATSTGIVNIGSATNLVTIASVVVPVYEYVVSPTFAAATFVNGTAYPIYTFPNDGTTWKLIFASLRATTAGGASSTCTIYLDPSGTAPGAGTAQFAAAAIDGTANTVVNFATPVNTTAAAGNAISLKAGGAATTGLVGLVVTICMQRLS